MGRLSTAVASVGVDAGNLPEELPNVSLIDALLPASWSSRSSKVSHIAHFTCKSRISLRDEGRALLLTSRNIVLKASHRNEP